ncbi:MAG: hypothetical protein ACRDFY_00380 [Candidatus Limnocylindria bacterium]
MNDERDAKKVHEPSGRPPDEGLAYDPEMTEADEANIPAESDADPEQALEGRDAETITTPR